MVTKNKQLSQNMVSHFIDLCLGKLRIHRHIMKYSDIPNGNLSEQGQWRQIRGNIGIKTKDDSCILNSAC